MHSPTLPKIPKRVIPHAEIYLKQRTQDKQNFTGCEFFSHRVALLKYYPKYCRSLHLDDRFKVPSLLSRIRQVKTTNRFHYDFIDPEKKPQIIKTIKRLLRNKRRFLKHFPSTTKRSECPSHFLMEMCPFFPNIEFLDVDLDPDIIPQDASNHLVLKSYGYFWSFLRHLQYLTLKNLTPQLYIILQKLQCFKKFGPSLKSFALRIVVFSEDNREYYNPNASLQALLKHQNVLKYLTFLDFEIIENISFYQDQIKAIFDSCPRLSSLSFPIEYNFSDPDEKFSSLSSILRWAPFLSLQKITTLTLNIRDIWNFIQIPSFPPFLQKLTLHFWQFWDDSILEKNPNSQEIQDYEKFLDFFTRFQPLTCLSFLKLRIRSASAEAENIMNGFVLPLLKSAPNLENFEWQLKEHHPENYDSIDMSGFLNEISSLEKLKSLKISQQVVEEKVYLENNGLNITWSPLKSFSFPSLTSINFDTWISENFNFKEFFKMISINPSKQKREISFSRIYFESTDSLLELLKIAKEASQEYGHKIHLGIALYDELENIFEDLNISIPVTKDVSVDLKIFIPNSRNSSLEDEEIKVLTISDQGVSLAQRNFGNWKFSIYFLISEDPEYPCPKYIKYYPIIQNNRKYVNLM